MKKILLICFTLITLKIYGQNREEVGMRVLYGVKNEILPEHKIYKPILILPYYNHYFTKYDKKLRWSGFVEAMIVPVIIDYQNQDKKSYDFELGFNIGPTLSYRFKWFEPYIAGAYGADVITVDTKKQSNGYIFTATAFTGIKKEICNGWYGDIHFRLRHISNGNMKMPNKGIDTRLLGIGVSKLF